MAPINYVNLGSADIAVVRRLCLHLLDAFQSFKDAEEAAGRDLAYLDALMGCHNFYKSIILNLEELAGDDEGLLRKIAIDTMQMYLLTNPAEPPADGPVK